MPPSHRSWNRREVLGTAGAVLGGLAALPQSSRAAEPAPEAEQNRFRYCFNTSTIRGQKLGIVAQVDLAAEAGYDAIEPWIRDIQAYSDAGGSLQDLRKRIADHGLEVPSAIGFARWIVDEDEERAAGLEQARHDMHLLSQIGGTRIAAPPVGATDQTDLDLFAAARRYRALLELGDELGVIPQVEVWGFSKSLSRLGESVFVAIESGHPKACLLPDVYHIYKGGSDFAGLNMLSGKAIPVFHMNDYPADPPRETIRDANRVYPGDGVAPLTDILRTLRRIGFDGMLSLELFNPDYWKQNPLEVARTGLRKMQEAVEKSGIRKAESGGER